VSQNRKRFGNMINGEVLWSKRKKKKIINQCYLQTWARGYTRFCELTKDSENSAFCIFLSSKYRRSQRFLWIIHFFEPNSLILFYLIIRFLLSCFRLTPLGRHIFDSFSATQYGGPCVIRLTEIHMPLETETDWHRQTPIVKNFARIVTFF